MTKVGNWEGGEVEEYNRAITASKWVDHDKYLDDHDDDEDHVDADGYLNERLGHDLYVQAD